MLHNAHMNEMNKLHELPVRWRAEAQDALSASDWQSHNVLVAIAADMYVSADYLANEPS